MFSEKESLKLLERASLPVFRRWKGVAILLNDVLHSAVTLDLLALESSGLNSRVKVCGGGVKMEKKRTDSGTTWP